MVETDITVLIPTMARPDSLMRALRSVFAQTGAALIKEIVVVDNAPDASARPVIEALRSTAPSPLIYIHAQPPGVATARNAGLAASSGRYIAFLDDDEEAHLDWLANLARVHLDIGADVTFGPVQGRADGAAAWKRPYLQRFFSRMGPAQSGLIETVFGCGNAIMTRATALAGPAPFDIGADNTGGEDDRLFAGLRAVGARFAWAADAVVDEHAPAHRATIRYALSRAVGYGQAPTKICLRRADWLGAMKWVAVGVVQTLVYGAATLGLLLLGQSRWLDMADRTARGVGKTLWSAHLHYYGQSAAARSTATKPERDAPALTAQTADIGL